MQGSPTGGQQVGLTIDAYGRECRQKPVTVFAQIHDKARSRQLAGDACDIAQKPGAADDTIPPTGNRGIHSAR